MKRKIVVVLLAGTLAFSLMLGGCGKKKEAEQPADSVSVVSEEPEQESEYLAPGVELPEESDAMISVMKELMAAIYDSSGEYYNEDADEMDQEFYWTALQYLISADALEAPDAEVDDAAGTITMGAPGVADYAAALFGNYDVEAEGLPEIPEGCNFVEYQEEDDTYTFEIMKTDDLLPYITICDPGDEEGTYKLQADLKLVSDEEVLLSCGFIMKESDYSGSGRNPYHYTITSCINLDEEGQPDETDTDGNTDADEPDDTQAQNTDGPDNTTARPSKSNTDDPDNTDAQPSKNNSISQSKAQGLAKSYMDEHVGDDGGSYSMSYAGTKSFDGIDYYSYKVTKSDENGNSSYVTNIYVDAATGNDVWDEAE